MSRFIDPYTDFGLKRLLGSDGNKDIFIGFRSCLVASKHQIIFFIEEMLAKLVK